MFDDRKKKQRGAIQGTGARRASGVDCFRPHGASPLQWWRTERHPHLDAAAITRLRTALSKLHLFAHPTWPDAIAGDATAVVRIAMTIHFDAMSPTWLIDCAGSLAVLAAAEGSETAAAVLRHFRERYVVPKRCRARRSA